MSLPRQIAPQPSSPKSPFRGVDAPNHPTRSLLPSPHFEELQPQQSLRSPQPAPQIENESAISGEPYGELPAPPFLPFFALIEDGTINEHYHPTVHYIFADDDADIITEAACRSLSRDSPHTYSPGVIVEGGDESEVEHKLPLPQPGIREHYLILDVHPTDATGQNYEVTSAQSLSSEWQILTTSISNAPTMDAGVEAGEEEGLMLKIEGRRHTPLELGRGKGKTVESRLQEREETLEQMAERFQKGLAEINRFVEPG